MAPQEQNTVEVRSSEATIQGLAQDDKALLAAQQAAYAGHSDISDQRMKTDQGKLSFTTRAEWKQLKADLPGIVANLPPPVPGELARVSNPADPNALALILAHLRRDGGVIVENAVAPEICDAVMQECEPYLQQIDPSQSDAWLGPRTKRLGGIFARTKASWELGAHPLIMEVAAGVVSNQLMHEGGPSAVQMGGTPPFHISATQLIQIHPGEPAQPMHRDRPDLLFLMGGVNMEPQLGTAWALDDIDLSRGPTRVVPGSHKWPADHPPPADEDACHAHMKKGSVLLYGSSTYHGGGANKNTEGLLRSALFLTYNLGSLTQEENQYVACPPEIAKDLPLKIQNLLGYTKIFGLWGFGPDFPEAASAQRAFERASGKQQMVNWASDWQAKGPHTDWQAQGVPGKNQSKL